MGTPPLDVDAVAATCTLGATIPTAVVDSLGLTGFARLEAVLRRRGLVLEQGGAGDWVVRQAS